MFLFSKTIAEQNEKINELEKIVSVYKTLASPLTTCCVCTDNPKEYANIVCGHLCVCKTCSNKLQKKCPICKRSGNFIRIFFS